MKEMKLYKIELTEYELELLVNNSLIYGILGSLLKTAKKLEDTYYLPVSLAQLTELIGFVAAEANHSESKRLQNDLNELCDYLEGIEYSLKKRNL
jgi:hypothetical protein